MLTKMRTCLFITLTLLTFCANAGQAFAGSVLLHGAGATFP